MDYKAEQETEKEGLALLYEHMNEFDNIDDNSFKILLENKAKQISFYILFEYTEKYPDEAPKYKIVEDKNLTEVLRKNIERHIEETIANNLGYSMIYNIVEDIRTYITEDIEEKSMYDEMVERQGKLDEEENSEDLDDDQNQTDTIENVLESKELVDERYRVTDKEFEAWRKEFYKDIFIGINNINNSENPTGRELFEKGKINILDTDFEEGKVEWCHELFRDIDLNI
ncbi:RWD domain-containing protein, putative [Hepatocystis sp. ex Piliocolobus tephrosceles]|nr:RWD domain-containing protein, putative [Hepatocystis sp. ex Piliocolobus tephrosceles]